MAYPTVGGYSSCSNDANSTSHSIIMPGSISAGDLLLVLFVSDGICTHSINTSVSGNKWVTYDTNDIGDDNTGITATIYYKVAETTNALTITTSEGQYSSCLVYRIVAGSYDTNFEHSKTGVNSSNPNLTTCSGLFSAEALWIGFIAHNNTVVASAPPTSFTGLLTQAGTGSESCSISSARREYTGTSLDPDAFTASISFWVGWLIKISAPGYAGFGMNYNFKTVSIV